MVRGALLLNPDLILVDEAISALDVSLRVEMMDLLLDLHDEHVAACFREYASHEYWSSPQIEDDATIEDESGDESTADTHADD